MPSIAAVMLLSVACASNESQVVSVAPAPAPAAATFVLGDQDLVYGLTVSTCNGRTMWTLINEKLGLPPDSIRYGVAPPGFASRTGPAPLRPGCYEVTVSGPAHARFHIGGDGRLTTPNLDARPPHE
jgi:hypothetical protein